MVTIQKSIRCLCNQIRLIKLSSVSYSEAGFICAECNLVVVCHGSYDIVFDIVFKNEKLANSLTDSNVSRNFVMGDNTIKYVKDKFNIIDEELKIDLQFINTDPKVLSNAIKYLIKQDHIKQESRLKLINKYY